MSAFYDVIDARDIQSSAPPKWRIWRWTEHDLGRTQPDISFSARHYILRVVLFYSIVVCIVICYWIKKTFSWRFGGFYESGKNCLRQTGEILLKHRLCLTNLFSHGFVSKWLMGTTIFEFGLVTSKSAAARHGNVHACFGQWQAPIVTVSVPFCKRLSSFLFNPVVLWRGYHPAACWETAKSSQGCHVGSTMPENTQELQIQEQIHRLANCSTNQIKYQKFSYVSLVMLSN